MNATRALLGEGGPGCRVLLVTDERIFREIVGAMVSDAGFGVDEARRGESARHALARCTPRVMVCDGAARCRMLRAAVAAAAECGVPVLLLRGRAEEPHAPGTGVAGEVAQLRFPVSRLAFVAVLDALLPPARLTLSRAPAERSRRRAEPAGRRPTRVRPRPRRAPHAPGTPTPGAAD